MPKTKSFIVAVAGPTVDGRNIEASWLNDIAATYNPATYGARVNKEHIAGLSGTEPFKAYGDVLGCTVENVEIELGGKKVKTVALRAEIEATDDLVKLVADKQKIYTSIEVAPNFAGSGKAGLVGLAVTDTPASLGTEALTFAVQHHGLLPQLPRRQTPDNVFSIGYETKFELADGTMPAPVVVGEEARGFFAQATAFFQKLNASSTAAPAPAPAPTPAPAVPANDNDAKMTAIGDGIAALTKGIEAMGTKFAGDMAKVTGDVAALTAKIETTAAPGQHQRSLAAGGNATQFQADC